MRNVFLHIILCLVALPSVYGQLNEEYVKANFIINLVKFFEWKDEDALEYYTIGVMGDTRMFEELQNISENTLLKDKAFQVELYKRLNDVGNVQILYVEQEGFYSDSKLLEFAVRNNLLMVSDSSLIRESIMINLLDLDQPGSQFEINKENLERAGFQVPDKLLVIGGTEEDLRDLYQASEQELTTVQEELEKQLAELSAQQAELERKRQEIEVLNEEIRLQEENLDRMREEVAAQQESLDNKIALLEEQEVQIAEHQADIENQNRLLQQQQAELEKGVAVLDQQRSEIRDQEQRIADQQEAIREQTATLDRQSNAIKAQNLQIEKQQTLLYFFIAIFILVAAMIFFILRAYRIKRQANKVLEEKNAAISQQKEEIQSQQEQLQIVNQKIQKQNKDIKSSIHYALTIQEAMLPTPDELAIFPESFVFYLPRDIVSGDFYWMCLTPQYTFVAVADCTGHGVPGAFLSMIGIKILNSIVRERKEYDPATILELLSGEIQEALKQEEKGNDDGMDICLCRLERGSDSATKVVFAGARRPLYFSQGQTIQKLSGDRKTIGGRFYQDQIFHNQELELPAGSRIYLTTDGLADQNASNRRKFGSKRLIQLLTDTLHLPLADQKRKLEEALGDFQQQEKQRDDISLLAIKL